LANLVFCQLLKRYAKWKKSSSPIVWHNSLTKSRCNLHQESWEKQNYVCVLPHLENLRRNPSLFFISFFTLSPTGKHRWQPRSARAYMRVGRWVLPSFYVCQVGLPNCWRLIFLILPKVRWMPSWFAKLLELLARKGKHKERSSKSISKSLPNFTWQILCFANF
jgi:hypothetical protein